MRRGEIWLVDFPEPAGAPGREQLNSRPALIISQQPDPNNQTPVVIPLTSTLKSQMLPHTLIIAPDRINGLTTRSVLLVLQIRAIDQRRIKSRIGELDPAIITQVEQMIRVLLKL
jgi:mRNA-degrading endonuclease toxin of MazEF toxin-antitoxin module